MTWACPYTHQWLVCLAYTFVYGAAVEAYLQESEPRDAGASVYVGDYDPAGLQIADTLETKLIEHLDYAAEDYDR